MKQKTGRKLLSFLLTLAMVVGLMPGMGLTAYAATSHGITINTAQHGTVTASVNGSAATSAEEGATVTLTANPDNGYRLKSISGTYKGNPQETKGLNGTKTINGTYFNLNATDAASRGWKLANNSTITITSKDTSEKIVKVDFNITQRGNSFNLNNVSCSAGTKSLNGITLSVSSINGTTVTLSSSANNAGYVRFSSVTIYGTGAVDTNLTISTTGDVNVRTFTMPTVVQGDVTITPVFEEIPKYNVTLNGGANAITSGGNTTQTGVTGAMTTVTYTANSGYHFTEFANITNNGITATRTSDTAVTVSGTPTADASITIPDAVADAVAVTGVTLNPSAAQTIDVDGTVSFTATVLPDDATDKTVKWSVGGTDTGAVKLYSDEACTTEVGADAIETLTVYAKGISAGSATVTATSNADSEKKASCDVTVNAAQTQTETLLTTITATAKEQASYSTANVATVSFSYSSGGSSAYRANWGWWGYGWTATVTPADGYTITKCVFYDDANRTATDSEAPFVVETAEEGDKAPKVNGTPILAYTSKGIKKIEVYGYATPTATHSVTITPGDNMTKTAGSGDAEQTGLTGAMTDVVYTADNGYYYPTDYSVAEVSGIKVTRDSYTQITVSGTPTADATITLTAPTAKTTPAAPTTAGAVDCTTSDNNDGKLTGVTTAMEYKKSDAADWTAGTGSDITGLVPGTYYVRVKATDTSLASDNQQLTIKAFGQKETATVTKAPTAKTLTYNGSAQELVNAGEATGGEMQYALGTKDAATEEYTTSIPAKTDAGTYYVWYKAVGDETHTDSEAKCITVTISSESSGGGGGSSSSGGGSSTPSTPTTPTESYTVPVSSENTVNVTTNISNGTAVVSEITQSDIDKIVDNGNNSGGGDNTEASENTSITIDVSQAKSEVTSVQLSEKTVEKLTEAVKADNNVESVKIKMTNATIELDGAALSAVSEQAEGSSIKLVVEDTQTTKLNATQQESLKQFASAKPFQAYFESNGKEIHDFKGGKATVSIKFLPESGRDVKHYHMYYLPVTGAIERYVTRYAGGMLSFVTTHFSDYAIVYDETMENETGKDTGTGDGSSETGDGANTNADGTVTGDNSESGNVDAGDESQTDTLSDSTANGKTAYQNAISINKGLKVSQTGNKLNISWGKVSGADRYEVYAAYCGKKFGKNPVKIVTGAGVTTAVIKKLDGKKLNLKKNFKVYVVAYKTVSGKKQKLGKTIVAHVIGRKNAAYTNIKAIKLEKSKATIKKGKTWRIKATVVLVDSSKKMLPESHAATFRYASSNKKIATVNKNGKVKAKKKGTCYIWIYAKNGCAKKIKVTVQ